MMKKNREEEDWDGEIDCGIKVDEWWIGKKIIRIASNLRSGR